MAFGGVSVTVGTTPVKLGSTTEGAFIQNTGAAAITLGGANVAVGAGPTVAATNGSLQVYGTGSLYAVSGGAGNTVLVLIS